MNKYVEIIKQALDEIICDPFNGGLFDLDEDEVLKIIAAVELATKLIRTYAPFSSYADFFHALAPAMDENEHILKMAARIRVCSELKI